MQSFRSRASAPELQLPSMAESGEEYRRKIIIDTDCGVDDALALLLALSKEYENSVDILGITCVSGNVKVEQVCINVLKVLGAANRTDIPVYKGAYKPLLAHNLDASFYHGKDGLGDAADIPEPDMTLLKEEHAVDYLVRVVKESPGEITLVAVGPLTNLALACQMDPNFCTYVKKAVIMGGNIEARGNISVCGEFNFYFDPEAAFIVLDEFCCPVEILTWEVCLRRPLNQEFVAQYTNQKTTKGQFLKKIVASTIKFHNKVSAGEYVLCDQFAVAVAIQPDIVLKEENVYATVELQGKNTRGQMVIDWRGILGKKPNVSIPVEINMVKFKSSLIKSVQ